MFLNPDNRKIFINNKFLDLIIGPKDNITDYYFWGIGPDHPILVKNKKNELLALLMPVKVTEDDNYK